jgi:predicted nucleic acid-binding protein
MIVLDTNVLSEMMKAAPDRNVNAWLAAEPAAGLFISTITEAELHFGAALLPVGKRRQGLIEAIESLLTVDFAGRIIPFDSPAARAFASIAADRRRAGRPISQSDAQIAAIAQSRGASVATRKIADFDGCGIDLINPWTVSGSP